jgi:hypothetical protein
VTERRDAAGQDRLTCWQGVLAFVPLYLGALGFVGLLLAVLAARGHWVFFWVLLGVETYIVIALVVLARQRSRKSDQPR